MTKRTLEISKSQANVFFLAIVRNTLKHNFSVSVFRVLKLQQLLQQLPQHLYQLCLPYLL